MEPIDTQSKVDQAEADPTDEGGEQPGEKGQDVARFDKEHLPPSSVETWPTFRKTAVTSATRIVGPFVVGTSEGELRCQDGWLAVDARGYPYPIAAEEFSQIYQEVPPGTELVLGQAIGTEEAMSQDLLAGTLQTVRQQYLSACLQFELTSAGHPMRDEQGHPQHPEQVKKNAQKLRGAYNRIKELVEGGTIPEPSSLEVVRGSIEVPAEIRPDGDGPSAA